MPEEPTTEQSAGRDDHCLRTLYFSDGAESWDSYPGEHHGNARRRPPIRTRDLTCYGLA